MARTGRPPLSPKVTRTCVCGKTWQTYEWVKGRSKYCSLECYHSARKGKLRGPYKIEKKMVECECCGELFQVNGDARRPLTARYCSKRCHYNGRWPGNPEDLTARDMSESEAAWLAGLFDGEGNICWPRKHLMKSVRLSISNTYLPLLERVREIVGSGRVIERKYKINNPRHSKSWIWTCHTQNSQKILRQMLPWLIVKRAAAEVALGLQAATEPPLPQRTLTIRAAEAAVIRDRSMDGILN